MRVTKDWFARVSTHQNHRKKLRWRYDIGDTVRIATTRHMPFAKGYATGNWTRELFVIATRRHRQEQPLLFASAFDNRLADHEFALKIKL